MKKHKCHCPEPGPSAPLYMISWGDMITCITCFFILLFAFANQSQSKMQATFSIMQGSLGISELHPHAPMQKNLPAPSVKQSVRSTKDTTIQADPKSRVVHAGSEPPTPSSESEETLSTVQSVRSLGLETHATTIKDTEEVTIVLPTYEVFERGSWKIDLESPSVKKAATLFRTLARQISSLHDYEIHFTGHTDSLPLRARPGEPGPQNNTELGFLRAVALFDAFFSDVLTDRTRVSFASQGDSVPIVPNANLDSERRKNRRVEITLRRVIQKET